MTNPIRIPYNFLDAVDSWECPPAVGNIPVDKVLAMNEKELKDFAFNVECDRYGGWRNFKNSWRGTLGLDNTFGKHVLDFGCGFGIEALQFAKLGNKISIADISKKNLEACTRVLIAHGYYPEQVILVDGEYPFFQSEKVDIFYANGVLHHTPKIREILQRVLGVLQPGGEARLMLYSDVAWRIMVGGDPPTGNSLKHPGWPLFVRKMDAVGHYADWYDEEKIRRTVDGLYNMVDFNHITQTNQYCTTTLVPK